jgi:hypothetical protein
MDSQYVHIEQTDPTVTDSKQLSQHPMSISDKVDLFFEWSKRHAKAIGRSLIIFFYYLIGVEYYHKIEGWNRTDSIYFITVSITTVGKMIFGRH